MIATARPRRTLYALIALALVALVAWGLWPRPTTVEVARLEVRPLTVGFTEEGRTRLRDRFTVTAPVDGELQRIELAPGDAVQIGQEVAVLHPARAALLDPATWADANARLQAAEAEHAAAAASLEAARSHRDRARRSLERLEVLARAQQVATEQRDQARSDLQAAEAQVRSAGAQAQAAASRRDAVQAWLGLQGSGRHDRAQLELRAPVAGVVIQRFVQSEGPVRAGQALLEVGDPRALEVVVEVLTADALRLRAGLPVVLRPGGDVAAVTGRIRTVEPGAFTKVSALGVEEQRVRVIVELPDDAPALGDAFRVDADFQVWQGPAVLAVPVAALFRDGEAWAAYAVDGGRARLRHLDIGHVGEDFAEVRGGLGEAALVVLYPGDEIRDRDRVGFEPPAAR
jgi:HlyD family secretion protein